MRRITVCQDFCADPARKAEELVTEVVTEIRNRGVAVEPAMAMAGERLGLTARRVRSLYYAQGCAVSLSLYEQIKIGVTRHLRAELAETVRKLAVLEYKIMEMERDVDSAGNTHETRDNAGKLHNSQNAKAAALRRDFNAAVACADYARRVDQKAK